MALAAYPHLRRRRHTFVADRLGKIAELRTSNANGSQRLADFTFLVAELNEHLSAEESTVLPLLEKVANT